MTTMSTADVAAQGPVTTKRASRPTRTVLESFSAGAPRGSWLAEDFAKLQRREGIPARVVMDLDTDSFLVVVESVAS